MNLVSHACHSYLHVRIVDGTPRTAMVMTGENVSNDVDEEVYVGDGEEVLQARQTSGGDPGEQSPMQIKQDSMEFLAKRKLHGLCELLKTSTGTVRMLHYATHVPFRDWCPVCVASRASGSPHIRVVVNKTADTLPKFQADHMFIRTVAESKTQPCITFLETRSGAVISFTCARKG